MNRVTPASSTGIVSSSGSAAAPAVPHRAGVDRGDDPADRLGQPVGADRLHDVVGGVHGERVDGVLVVGGDEDDLGPLGEPGDDPGQLHAVEPGHRDVGEDDVDVAGVEGRAARRRRSRRCRTSPMRWSWRSSQLSSSRAGASSSTTRARRAATRGAVRWRPAGGGAPDRRRGRQPWGRAYGVGCTPGAYLGTRKVTLVPAPGAVSTTRPKSSP